jgi:hypothetical protein
MDGIGSGLTMCRQKALSILDIEKRQRGIGLELLTYTPGSAVGKGGGAVDEEISRIKELD